MKAKIYISYKEIGKNSFDTLVTDAFKLTGKHAQKAYSIDDSAFATLNGVHGIYFNVGGEVATANQFFLTDSSKHFLVGSVYFYARPNYDSLLPAVKYLEKDIIHLIQTLEWE